MIIRFYVKEIDYEKCVENLIPQMIEDCQGKSNLSELEKLLVKLGDDAVPVMMKLLRYFDTDARDQLFAWILEDQQDMFVSTANKEIGKIFSEGTIVIGGFCAKDTPGPEITLFATDVKIDYEQLVESPALGGGLLGGAAKVAYQLSGPASFEKNGIKLLSSDLVKPMLMTTLSDSLEEAGLALTLGDVELLDDHVVDLPAPMVEPGKDEGLLPDAIEDRILDAVAGWLRDSL